MKKYVIESKPDYFRVDLGGKTPWGGNSVSLLLKKMKEDQFVIHYSLGSINGGRKFNKRNTEGTEWLQMINSFAECSYDEGLAQALIQCLHQELKSCNDHFRKVVELWDEGKIKAAQDLYGYGYGTIREEGIPKLRKDIALEDKRITILQEQINGTFDQGWNLIKNDNTTIR